MTLKERVHHIIKTSRLPRGERGCIHGRQGTNLSHHVRTLESQSVAVAVLTCGAHPFNQMNSKQNTYDPRDGAVVASLTQSAQYHDAQRNM
jgi:hypothetical protein